MFAAGSGYFQGLTDIRGQKKRAKAQPNQKQGFHPCMKKESKKERTSMNTYAKKEKRVTVAAVQMHCNGSREKNLEAAERHVREAAAQGAQIILLPELFETWYFCQERNYDSYKLAESWGCTARPTFPMTISIRKNFILLRGIPVSKCGTLHTGRSAWASAGISGFRRLPGVWR